jgi:sulfotransferase family protein
MRRTATELIPRLPDPVRTVGRNAIWAAGRLTARWRRLPDFLVIGAQKAGTTALYAYLRDHPAIVGPFWKEVDFFDRHWAKGEAWYRGQFPLRANGKLVGEASPSYVFHPLAPSRVVSLVPDVTLIVLLREPGDRAYSHYQHEVALGREALSFEDALAAEDGRLRGAIEQLDADPDSFVSEWWEHSYVSRGLYADQLERWLELFPREQLLVLTTDELGNRPAETYASVLGFLGASPHALDAYPRVFDREYAPMRDETRKALTARFAEPNLRLEELLGRPFGWPTP